jgi:tetratricopeptide (TPR) repeat protein
MTELALHLGFAERGKLHALAGDHREALIHYRAAIRMAVEQGAPEVFFRHYMECSLESLELTGAYVEVLEYCDRALAHYAAHPPEHDVARRDLAHVHQRRGVCLFKLGEREAAREALGAALAVGVGSLPLASALLNWLRSGWHCDAARIVAEQRRHTYFTVRADQVDPTRALDLPAALRPPA